MTPTDGAALRPVYTVSALTRQIKTLLETEFPMVWVSGEISNLHRPASGHYYFTLKDQTAQIGAVIFKGPAARLKFAVTGGQSIVGLGRLSVYEPRGTYQVIFEHIEPKGLGALQLAFEQLKNRLADEGLFDPAHKKKLPFLPRRVHIITSPTGAVVHDIIQIIQRRFPNMPITIIPVRVQGNAAQADIIRAIEQLNNLPDAELAIVARGGGSLEDLQPFNSDGVARAIFSSMVPIISAVGHETDFTIADFVADMRAPTPSAAAEIAVPEKFRLLRQVDELMIRLIRQVNCDVSDRREALAGLVRRLRNPVRQIQEARLKLDDIQEELIKRLRFRLAAHRQRLDGASARLARIPIRGTLRLYHQMLDQMNYKLLNTINISITKNRSKNRELTRRLEALNPINVLQRGYSITRTLPSRTVVRASRTVLVNQQVEIQLASGILLCRVEGKDHHGEEKF